MEDVLAPLLHNNVPTAVVESTALPQLFATVTVGAEGVDLGADVPLPAVLRTLVLDMLAKSPLARPTMSDVATRLSPLLKEGDGGPPSPTVTLPRKVARQLIVQRRRERTAHMIHPDLRRHHGGT